MMKTTSQLGFRPSGFSLIELMIAMTLGVAVVAAVTTLSLNSIRSYRAVNQANQQLENGRYALHIIKNDLEHAGFYGGLSPLKMSLTAEPDNPCDLTPQTHANSLLIPVRGFDADPCAGGDDALSGLVNGTSALVIRRADTEPLYWDKACGNWYAANGCKSGTGCPTSPTNCLPTAGNAYIQTTPNNYVIAYQPPASTPPPTSDFPLRRPDDESFRATLRRYHVHIYYIRDSSSSLVNDGIPTLVRVYLSNSGDAPTMATEALVEGIEDMQIQYGLDAALGTACPLSALPANCDGTPDLYVTASQIPADNWRDWANVVTVRVNLLARSLDTSPGYTDNKTYDLGTGTLISPGDKRYPRHVFSQVFRIHHTSGWRDREK